MVCQGKAHFGNVNGFNCPLQLLPANDCLTRERMDAPKFGFVC